MVIELISSMMTSNNSIRHDHDSTKHQGFDISFFSSCISGGGADEYLGLDRDLMDEFLVNDYELDIISSEHKTNIFVNGENSKSREDC